MKLSSEITINGTVYAKGDEISWLKVYPFFLFHMLMFGVSGFAMAYATNQAPLMFIYAHGGIAISVYVIFYLAMFGVDEVKWMFINAGLGVVGIYCELRWLLHLFGKNLDDYPWYLNITPFLYYVLYTFLLRHMVLDLFNAREDSARRIWVERMYVGGSLLLSGVAYWATRSGAGS